MIKSSELVVIGNGIVADETKTNEANGTSRNPEISRPSNSRMDCCSAENAGNSKENLEMMEIPKFAMIFNKYNDKLNIKPSPRYPNDRSADKYGPKYTMIFNKDVTIRQKPETSQSKTYIKDGVKSNTSLNIKRSTTDIPLKAIEPETSSVKLNDADMLMNLYIRSNLFIPEITCSMLLEDDENTKNDTKTESDSGVRLYNSLALISKNKTNRKADTPLKCKISSMTSLEMKSRDTVRRYVTPTQERKLFRVRSLDLTESVNSSDSDFDKTFDLSKTGRTNDNQMGKDESPRKGDNKSRGDSVRKSDKENGCRKQVQWKSEVDVIYFESHQAADGDRSGEILGRVMEPLREEWEQQRTGFYAKMVPLSLGSLNERWQSLLKI